jgi:hypothetical protein
MKMQSPQKEPVFRRRLKGKPQGDASRGRLKESLRGKALP